MNGVVKGRWPVGSRCFWLGFILSSIALSSCAVFQRREMRLGHKLEAKVWHSEVFKKSFSGFVLLDPENGKTLAAVNGEHYFIPASNNKILTLATCLSILGDTIPRLRYNYDASSHPEGVFELFATGDPTFLHPDFQVWQPPPDFLSNNIYSDLFLRRYRSVGLARWGKGWAWDDFAEGYSCEISSLPVFGNMMQVVVQDSSVQFVPDLPGLKWSNDSVSDQPSRSLLSADVFLPARNLPDTTYRFPMFDPERSAVRWINDSLHIRLLDLDPIDSYHHLNALTGQAPEAEFFQYASHVWAVTPIDTVLRKMMIHSDNFLAEQMLLVAAEEKFGWLNQEQVIHYMLDSVLTFLPQKPKWVDGSGLSRYNLITPQSITALLNDLWKKTEHQRLLHFFPKGGQEGTLAEYYSGKEGKAYVYAKSGSMSGVQCLSGYVECRSGKTLIFSFMHNNFVGSGKPWKLEMQKLLEWTRDHY